MKNEKIKKICFRSAGLLCVCLVFIILWSGLRYATEDDTESYTRVMMHELYEQKDIDYLFCGASLCYRSFDTAILDKELEANTFNSGSSSQTIDITYYLLKDSLDLHNIKYIYLELSPVMSVYYKNSADRLPSDMTNVYIISDYMRWSLPKVELLLGASGSEQYVNSFLVARRNWQTIYEPEVIGNILQKKESIPYRNFEYDNLDHGSERYKGKGYVECETRVDEGSFDSSYTGYDIHPNNIDHEWFTYLNKIINLCNDKRVKLTFVCSPLSEYFLAYHGSAFNDYHNAIKQIAEEAGVEFWDFSLVKNEFFPIDVSNYKDAVHLNMYGAKKFSELIARVIKGEISFNDIAYNTAEEKLNSSMPHVLGLVSSGTERRIISNINGALQYRIIAKPNEGEEYLIQDYSYNSFFSVNEREEGIICITSRWDDADEKKYDYSY